MFEIFTDRARKVMALANQEAQRLNHEYIGTEHMLLGLAKEGSGVGANVMRNLDVDLRRVRLEAESLVRAGPHTVTMGKLPTTPRANLVIENARKESVGLGHNYIGTEHLLLGLMLDSGGVAGQVLEKLGLTLDKIKAGILGLLSGQAEGLVSSAPAPETPSQVLPKEWQPPTDDEGLTNEFWECIRKARDPMLSRGTGVLALGWATQAQAIATLMIARGRGPMGDLTV